MAEMIIAPYGWKGEKWQPYYPDDLPQQWQLDYFSNEFRAVVIPASYISSKNGTGLITDWLDSVDEEFSFYFIIDKSLSDITGLLQIAQSESRFILIMQESLGKDETLDIQWYRGEDEAKQMRYFLQPLIEKDDDMDKLIIIDSPQQPWIVAKKCEILLSMMAV